MIALSTDTPEALASWAKDDEFPFLFASDPGAMVGKKYGAFLQRGERLMNNRTAFVIDPEGRIGFVAAPFREIDPTAYVELGEAIDKIAPAPEMEN